MPDALEFCRGLAWRHLLSSLAALAPVVYRQYRLSPRNPRIPNYRLEECHNADAGFQLASTLTLRTALQALRYALWDSDLERLVPFRFAAANSRCLRRISQHSGD